MSGRRTKLGKREREELIDQFNLWMADMDDALRRFREAMPAETRQKLDYSPDSLDAVESWILATYPSPDAMLEPDQAQALDGAARYIGETFQRNVGGVWDIIVDKPGHVFFKMPVLTGIGGPTSSDCPHSLATAAADRRTGTYLSDILNYYQEAH